MKTNTLRMTGTTSCSWVTAIKVGCALKIFKSTLRHTVRMLLMCFCVFLAVQSAQAQDQCAGALQLPGVVVPHQTPTATGCGVVITVTAVDANGKATAFVATVTGNGNPFDGVEDTLVGIQNSSGAALSSIALTSPNTMFGGLFGFDFDGPCPFGQVPATATTCSAATGATGYEGPNNTFTGISADHTQGTVTFISPIANGGGTWFALEGQPQSLFTSQTGPAMNPNSAANLSQQFVFNNTTGQHVEFDFVFTTAFNDPLTVVANTIPTVNNLGITQATYQLMVAGTALATTNCFIAPGEGTDSSRNPLCAKLTLTCTNQNNSTPAGDNCPQSTARNLLWANKLDITTPTIPAGTAPTMAMGSDTWSPGNCTLVGPEAGRLCPQSTLTQFESDCCRTGGTGTTGNSAFVAGCCEPEWNTVATVPAWTNSTTVPVSLTTSPPTAPPSPNNGWVAAQNQSITWGVEAFGATPDPTFPVAGDQTATNSTPCPTSWSASVAQSFTTGGNVSVSGPGLFEVHFFSTACDNQEELVFIPQTVGTANWATFKTVSFGVDSTAPTVTTPVLSGGLGGSVFGLGGGGTASFTCNDPSNPPTVVASGLAGCGNKVPHAPGNGPQGPPATAPTPGPLTQNITNFPVPTSTSGPQTLTVYATDLAGNQSSASVPYCVGYKIVSMDAMGNTGFTQPVLNPGSGAMPNINSANTQQAIPLQIAVQDCNGNPVTNLALAPAGTVVANAANVPICKVDNPDNSISTASAGSSGWQNLGGGVYQYNWKPLPPKGACLQFALNLGDNIQHIAYFEFPK